MSQTYNNIVAGKTTSYMNESVLVMFQADCFVRYRDTESTQSDVLWFTCFSRSVDHFREVKK